VNFLQLIGRRCSSFIVMISETYAVDVAIISSIVTSNGRKSPFRPVPAENVCSPTTPTESRRSNQVSKHIIPPPQSLSSRSIPNKGKSTSLNLPQQPLYVLSQRQDPAASQVSGTLATTIGSAVLPPIDIHLLTALAAQERRVLELKEELLKAEEDLNRLKKQWTSQESSKRRGEGRRVHYLRRLSSSAAKTTLTEVNLDDSSVWMYEEMGRRKALMSNARLSQRTVFSGSRHTRAFLLLAPVTMPGDTSSTKSVDGLNTRRSRESQKRPNPSLRSWTTSHLLELPHENPDEAAAITPRSSQSPEREIFRNGKKMATDFGEGLWTLFEDLKQVAIGDEGLTRQGDLHELPRQPRQAHVPGRRPSRKQHSGRTRATFTNDCAGAALSDAGAIFWKENGLNTARKPQW